jgi:hypothetical protein
MAALLSNIDDKIGLFIAIPLYCLWVTFRDFSLWINYSVNTEYWSLKGLTIRLTEV